MGREGLPTNCLSVFDHFMKLALKGLICLILEAEVGYDSLSLFWRLVLPIPYNTETSHMICAAIEAATRGVL